MSETRRSPNQTDASAMSSRQLYSNTSGTNIASGAGPSKRQAMKGQWQTPPVGEFFPSAAPAPATSEKINIPVGELPVPSTSDDYARALQEAYRRGAEAAAALSQSRNMSPSVSSPIFSPNNGLSAKSSNVTLSGQTMPSMNTAKDLPSSAATAATATPGATNMGVPTPIPFLAANATSQMTASPLGTHSSPLTSSNVSNFSSQTPSVSTTMASYVSKQPQAEPQSISTNQVEPNPVHSDSAQSRPAASCGPNQPSAMANNRSVSMPDMSNLENKVEDEEAKRLKRLARNRASARLRRLRKKNLVRLFAFPKQFWLFYYNISPHVIILIRNYLNHRWKATKQR
jgi:hypothetical protein